MSLRIQDLIDKRRRSWEKRRSVEYDAQLVEKLCCLAMQEASLRQEILNKPYLLIELAFTIVDKDKDTVPFFFNEVQRDFIKKLEEHGSGRPYYILKGRQQGFTSLITAIQLSYAIVRRNFSGFTIADCTDNTLSIFNDKAKTVYNRLPDILKPHEQYNSRKELFFDKLNSSWRIATATDDIGRSKTLEFLHMSEIAFYNCLLSNLQKGIGEALTKNSIVINESTANGYNEAKVLWDSGTCINLFYEWWRTAEYTSDKLSVLDDINDVWLKTRVEWLRLKGLSDNQIAWYVDKYNSYIDKNTIKQEYPCTPEEAFISSGECVFDSETIKARIDLARAVKPCRVGRFIYRKVYDRIGHYKLEDVRWQDDDNGIITIHEEPYIEEERLGDSKTGRLLKAPYTIGGDTSGDGSDYFTAKVINNRNLRTVATLRCQKMDEDLYGEQVACLGYMYHNALIGIEVNYSIVPNNVLLALNYPNIYRRQRVDTLTSIVEQKVGFATTSKTRPVIIADLVRLMREDCTIECDEDTLKEMLTFVKNKNGRAEASSGSHDDLVMALAIGHYCRAEQGQVEWIIEGDDFDIDKLFEEHKPRKGGRGLQWYSAK